MLYMWETIIRAVDPITGHLVTWQGPYIQAFTPGLAHDWCQRNGYGYCQVTGQRVIMEVPEKNGKADWSKAKSFEENNLN